jgi:hypothetical protein
MVLPSAVNGGVGSQPPALLLQPPKEQRTLLLNEAKLWSVLPKMTQIMPATRDLVLNSAQQNGLSKEQFLELMGKQASALSDSEKIIMENIRNAVPMPDENTVLQKVINPNYVDSYFDNEYMKQYPTITGYITTTEDVKNLNTPRELFDGLQLGYPNSPHSPDAEAIYVIQYTTSDVGNIQIPYGDDMPHPAGGKISRMTEPATGNGFIGIKDGSIRPEFYSMGQSMDDGAKLIRLWSDGQSEIIGTYDERTNVFKHIDGNGGKK